MTIELLGLSNENLTDGLARVLDSQSINDIKPSNMYRFTEPDLYTITKDNSFNNFYALTEDFGDFSVIPFLFSKSKNDSYVFTGDHLETACILSKYHSLEHQDLIGGLFSFNNSKEIISLYAGRSSHECYSESLNHKIEEFKIAIASIYLRLIEFGLKPSNNTEYGASGLNSEGIMVGISFLEGKLIEKKLKSNFSKSL